MERGGVTGIEGNDSIRACGFDVYSVIAPLSVLGPADIELVGFRGKGDRAFVVEVGDVLGIGNTDGFIGPEAPEIGRGVGPRMVRTPIELAAAVIGLWVDVIRGHDSVTTRILTQRREERRETRR